MKFQKGQIGYWKGRKRTFSSQHRKKLAKILLLHKVSFEEGHVPWNKGLKTGVKPWFNKKRPEISGINHYNWRGGSSRERRTLSNRQYKDWRNSVFERDNFTCQNCGLMGARLEAHHIKRWSEYPDLRFELSNGTTLCKDCHKKITYSFCG